MVSLQTALNIAMALTILGLICAAIRLIIGPTRADRVVALDLITILLVAIAAQLSMLYQVAAYLDLGLAIGLVGFLATVAFARYIENAPLEEDTKECELPEAKPSALITEHPKNSSESEALK